MVFLLSYIWARGIHLSDLFYLLTFMLIGFYIYLKWEQNYFVKRGIKSLPFSVPFFGHGFKVAFLQEHLREMAVRHYQSFPEEKYIGMRQFNQSTIQIRDLDLLKKSVVKDFDSFINHQLVVGDELDPLFGKSLIALKDDKWRDMRATLSPAFTSSKMRNMFDFMIETSEQFVEYFRNSMKEPENRERGLVETEMKDAFTRFTTDVIASTAFGIKVDSFKEKSNEFYQMAMKVVNFTPSVLIKFFITLVFPILAKLSFFNIFDKTIKDFYGKLVLGGMKMREEKGIHRPDMINILMEARKGTLKYESSKDENTGTGFATVEESQVGKRAVKRNWTDDDMVAQALIFLVGGFDSSSTLMCFMAHELAINQHIQRKLQKEIDEVVAKNGRIKVDYNELTGLKYLDMVVSESLRKWPVTVQTDRQCVRAYELPPSSNNSKPYTIQVGEGINIPIYAFHHDPKYFPNPEKFDPERFSDENKHNIVPMSYMPFGIGPRNCIGNRFALMEAKAVMFYLLANFDFVQTAKTQNPIKLKRSFAMVPEKGFWVGVRPRN